MKQHLGESLKETELYQTLIMLSQTIESLGYNSKSECHPPISGTPPIYKKIIRKENGFVRTIKPRFAEYEK